MNKTILKVKLLANFLSASIIGGGLFLAIFGAFFNVLTQDEAIMILWVLLTICAITTIVSGFTQRKI